MHNELLIHFVVLKKFVKFPKYFKTSSEISREIFQAEKISRHYLSPRKMATAAAPKQLPHDKTLVLRRLCSISGWPSLARSRLSGTGSPMGVDPWADWGTCPLYFLK